MWVFKRDFVRRVGGLILVRNVLNFFIIYSIEKGVGGGCLPSLLRELFGCYVDVLTNLPEEYVLLKDL